MIKKILLFFLRLSIVGCTCPIYSQNLVQQTDFKIFSSTDYVPSVSYNLITNITDKSIYFVGECARKCLQYELCATATFYPSSQTCLLYREMCGLGQLVNVASNIVSTIVVTSRYPEVPYCYQSADLILQANQFIYSSNQLYAFGIKTPNWGLFNVGANGNINSNYWQPAGTISNNYTFQLQIDGNLVLYTPSHGAAWALGGQGSGNGAPYTMYVSNTGHLIQLDRTNQVAIQYY